jgi:hypothetical protein
VSKKTKLTKSKAGSGAAYMLARDIAANLRRKDDYVSSAIGGAATGAVLGAARKFPQLLELRRSDAN